jgi:hypothetical protein
MPKEDDLGQFLARIPWPANPVVIEWREDLFDGEQPSDQ